MKSVRLAVAAVFSNRQEAELARAILRQLGIKSALQTDDAGGLYPALSLVGGVRLLVDGHDLPRAQAALEYFDGSVMP